MMTESVQRYHLRLTKGFGWYDLGKSEMWREWSAGQIVSAVDDIRLLESIAGAPVVRVEVPADPRLFKR